MRTIRRIGAFKRDYKREKRAGTERPSMTTWLKIVAMLANDEPLAAAPS